MTATREASYRARMRILRLVTALLLTGCATTDVSRFWLASDIQDKCYRLTETTKLIKKRGSDKERALKYTNWYYFLRGESEETNRTQNEQYKSWESLDPGTQIRISKVVHVPFGSAGPCWVVKARIESGPHAGTVAEVPSCWVYDRPLWVSPPTPPDDLQHPDIKLSLVAPQVKPCDE